MFHVFAISLLSVQSCKRLFISLCLEWLLSHCVELFYFVSFFFFFDLFLSLLTHILEVFELLWSERSYIALNMARFVTFLISCDSMFHTRGPSAKKSGFPVLCRHHCCCFKILLLLVIAFILLETQALKNHEVGLQITWFLFF